MKQFKNPNLYITIIFLTFIFVMLFINGRQLIITSFNRYKETAAATYSRKEGIKNVLQNIKSDAENTDVIKTQFIEFNGLFRKLIGQSYVEDVEGENTVIKLKNGYLSFIMPEYDTTKDANNLIELSNELKKQNVELLYIQAPFKINKYSNDLPLGIEDYSNKNTDEFLKSIDGKVNYIDIREEIEKDNLNIYDYFFKTDHHWKPELAFYAFEKVSEELNNNYGFNIPKEVTELSNYEQKVYKEYFLGSQGKRIGKYYGGVDDITLMYPKFETNLRHEIPPFNIDKTGTFSDAIFDYEHINTKDYYNKNPYAVYTGGDYQFSRITNNLVKDKKVLLIRDSFACTFAPFLSLGVHQLDIIDLRFEQELTISEYVEKNDIDMVLILYNGGQFSLNHENMFEFN